MAVKFEELYIGALDVVSILISCKYLVKCANIALVQEWIWSG